MLSVLVRVTDWMMKEHLWNIIGLDDEGLILVSHPYARVVARWLEVLASYAGQSNLTVITSGTILERLRTWRVVLSPR